MDAMGYAVPEESTRPGRHRHLGLPVGYPDRIPGVPDNDLHEDDHGPEAKSSIMTVCTSGFAGKKNGPKNRGH